MAGVVWNTNHISIKMVVVAYLEDSLSIQNWLAYVHTRWDMLYQLS